MKKLLVVLSLIALVSVSCNKVIYPAANVNGPTVTVGNGKVHVSESIHFNKNEVKQFFDSLMAGAQYHNDVFDIGMPQDSTGYSLIIGLTFQTK